MKRNIIALILLYPFALMYGGIISLRNIFYEAGLLKSIAFNIPVINVGNLSIGGTGKTPHIEYLIRLLTPYINVATLSRGYKRKSKGFRMVNFHDKATVSGDEPLQFKTKFPHIPVAVSESRDIGIPMMLKQHPEIESILLDDAFQHRSVIPGLNVLLSAYNRPFYEDYLMPAGRLREPREAYERADIIIVTKCPGEISPKERKQHIADINPFPHQTVLFSRYDYETPYYIFDDTVRLTLGEDHNVILISAIANVDYLLSYLSDQVNIENTVKFEDHHYFTDMELEQFKKIYENADTDSTYFLTTEKDAMRLGLHKEYLLEHNIPVFVLPAQVSFLDEDADVFEKKIKEFLIEFKT